ncbi:MAG: TRAP transporter small permease subunit, partial [Deltaproteobacteria bacterium]|nr:TRAP transporter small permease subunit [Deltaproteobacteria bacterium]
MDRLKGLIRRIDSISEWSGRICAWLAVPLVGFTAYDVIMRYLFQAPTKWAYEMTWMQYGALFMLGGAYGLKHKIHVRVDIIYNRWSVRTRAIFDLLTYLLIFFPVFYILLTHSAIYAYYSWEIWETSYVSYWQPPVYPIKTVMFVAILLFSLQGIAEFLRL